MSIFRFKRVKEPNLRKENKRLFNENRKLHKRIGKLEKVVVLLQEQLKDLQHLNREYQELLFKKKSLSARKTRKDTQDDDDYTPKPKGAPKNHRGTTRQIPDRVDEHKDIHLSECPGCSSKKLSLCKRYHDHYQEDIVIPQTNVTRFRHHYYYCQDCKRTVHGTGDGELVGSFIGPNAKALAGFLHYCLAIPYRKIKLLFKELFNMEFDPTSCVGFDKQIRLRGEALYKILKNNLKTKPYLHVDETGWKNKWLWCFADKESAVYKIESGRGQKEVEDILGESFGGVLISDLLGAYNKIQSAKQKCLVHILRLIDKWRTYYDHDAKTVRYLTRLKKIVKEIIALSEKLQRKRKPKHFSVKKADLIGQLKRLLTKEVKAQKADKFRRKLLDQFDELIACLNFKGISAHNNLVERLLRPSVIMRKITFGNRSEKGIRNHEVLTSLIQTARLKKHNPLPLLYTLLTKQAQAAKQLSLDLAR